MIISRVNLDNFKGTHLVECAFLAKVRMQATDGIFVTERDDHFDIFGQLLGQPVREQVGVLAEIANLINGVEHDDDAPVRRQGLPEQIPEQRFVLGQLLP